MNTVRFAHQQVFQLKWHILACVGLIMGLPLEEAVVNLHAGEGFHSSSLTAVTLLLGPLLAGLIACANVQADLDEKRDAFWRSKPVGVGPFITGKFVIGLILSLVIVACPVLFAEATTRLADGESLRDVRILFLFVFVMSWLTYSVCFFCNVLVRKTARAWLIGVAIACFALLIPFVLPLNIKDVATDLVKENGFLNSILVVTLGLAVLSYIGSIVAVQRNWQIHTHLRSLLWGGAGLIFVLFLLFSRQIANIKILDEQRFAEHTSLDVDKQHGRLLVTARYEVTSPDDTLHLTPTNQATSFALWERIRPDKPLYEVDESLERSFYPNNTTGFHFQRRGRNYTLRLDAFYVGLDELQSSGSMKTKRSFKKLYLRCTEYVEGYSWPVSFLDLSDQVEQVNERGYIRFGVQLTRDRAFLHLNEQCLVLETSEPNNLAVVERKPLKRLSQYMGSGMYQLLPVESIPMSDR
ncbi:MAG: hypothetical protein GY809_21160, partial [Planctomycetes bacterium]|nr:hypothetical protein [Planctomycetota bacterium]